MYSIAKAAFLFAFLCAVQANQYPMVDWKFRRFVNSRNSFGGDICYDCGRDCTGAKAPSWTEPHQFYCEVAKANHGCDWTIFHPRSYCICQKCQRDCTLAEVKYDVNQCKFDRFDYEENDIGLGVANLFVDLATNLAGSIPVYGPFISPAMSFGSGIFNLVHSQKSGNPLSEAMQEHTEKNNKKMVKCMDQKISKAVTDNVIDMMQWAGLSYRVAAIFTVNEDLSNADEKLNRLHNAWADFLEVSKTRFDNELDTAKDYKNLLLPLQDFIKAYELLCLDYLLYMHNLHPENYQTDFVLTISSIDTLLVWVRRAKYFILDGDMRGRLGILPCRNDREIEDEVRAWENQFDANNVKPLLKFMGDLHQLNRILDVTVDTSGKSTAYPCSLITLSVDHKEKAEGTYFNFDKKQLDAILGTTSWSGDKLKVSNGKEVVVWRSANGGSKGDAHGRWAVDPKAYQFWIGQPVTFADCKVPKVCTLQVLAIENGHYDDGMFFNFDKSALDAILGRSDWDNEKLEIGNDKTVQIWRTQKGSKGDAHGRYDPKDSAEESDWSVGDQITFADCEIKLK